MLILAVLRKNLISALRGEYIDFVISRITGAVFIIATAQILYQLQAGQTSPDFKTLTDDVDYRAYIVVGAALYAVSMSIFLNVSRILMTELRQGTIESVFLAPFPRWQFYLGAHGAQILLTSFDLFLAFAIGGIMGIRFEFSPYMLILGFALLYLSLFGISVLTSLLMIHLKDTYLIQNSIFPILIMGGGFLFPLEFLPDWLEKIFFLLPLHRAVHLVRIGLLPVSSELGSADIPRFAFGFGASLLGLMLLPVIERRAVEKHLS